MRHLITVHIASVGVLADTGLFQMATNTIAKLQTLLLAIAALVGIGVIIYVAFVTRFSIPKILAAFLGAGLLWFAVRHIATSGGTIEKTTKELGGILIPPGLGHAIGTALTHAAGHPGGLGAGWF